MPQLEDTAIQPTDKQAQTCLRVCQKLSNYYRDIQLFSINEQKGYVYILTSDNLEIIVYRDGNWEFINETTI
ncbi:MULTISPECIES: DUF6888 family protein [Planktothrix]|uniref:DUF6888 family protein n=1 Tax=Planktothrix TaxID=54304 RepID=UPI00047DAF65|nr:MULTISPECIES: hypothetical protein [Planktothrix]